MLKKRLLNWIIMILLLLVSVSTGCGHYGTPPDIPPAIQVSDRLDVENWIKNSPTFQFDGISGSIETTRIKSLEAGNTVISTGTWEFTVQFLTSHPGHGDRSAQILDQIITVHTAVIQTENGVITSALCDNTWPIPADHRLDQSDY